MGVLAVDARLSAAEDARRAPGHDYHFISSPRFPPRLLLHAVDGAAEAPVAQRVSYYATALPASQYDVFQMIII